MTGSFSTIAHIGADGNLGPNVYQALTEAGFDVTVIKRKSSKSKSYDKQKTVSDGFEVDDLAEALRGFDAVVITISGMQTEVQSRVADACVRAGVKRLIPADFGSCDSSSPLTQELVPLYRKKTALREHCIKLAEQNPSFTWTSIVNGHFFDWSLEFLHMDLHKQEAEILDDGETKWSASTLARIAEATVKVLQSPDTTKNRMLYVQSFCVSQNEVIAAFERATGSKWKVVKYDSKAYKEEEKPKADAGSHEASENLVWLLGAIDANWTTRKGFAMKELGLEDEDLDTVVKGMVEKFKKQ